MKQLPKRIVVCGDVWTVEESDKDEYHVSDPAIGPKCFGSAGYTHFDIIIAKNIPFARKLQTFKHELGHIMCWYLGHSNDESFANIIKIMIDDILKIFN